MFYFKLVIKAMSVNFSQETQAVTGTSNTSGALLGYTEL